MVIRTASPKLGAGVGEGVGEAARRMTVKRSNPAHFWEAKVLGAASISRPRSFSPSASGMVTSVEVSPAKVATASFCVSLAPRYGVTIVPSTSLRKTMVIPAASVW